MGYNTDFSGRIQIEPQLTLDHFNCLNDLRESSFNGTLKVGPDSYLKWEPTKNGRYIQWDECEKFYNSVEWMQFIIDQFPEYIFTGEISAQGDDMDDRWILKVADGKAVKIEQPLLGQKVRCPHCDEVFLLESTEEDK